jgi:hypothetical protein
MNILINLLKSTLGVNEYPMKSPDEKRIIVKIRPEKIFRFPFSWDQVLGKQ